MTTCAETIENHLEEAWSAWRAAREAPEMAKFDALIAAYAGCLKLLESETVDDALGLSIALACENVDKHREQRDAQTDPDVAVMFEGSMLGTYDAIKTFSDLLGGRGKINE